MRQVVAYLNVVQLDLCRERRVSVIVICRRLSVIYLEVLVFFPFILILRELLIVEQVVRVTHRDHLLIRRLILALSWHSSDETASCFHHLQILLQFNYTLS